MSLQRIVRNAASLTVMRAFTALASFSLLVYLARRWPATTLGEFSTLNAMALMMLPLPMLGVHTALIRDVIATPSRTGVLGSSAVAFAGMVATVGAMLIAGWVMLSYPRAMWPAGCLVALSALPTAYTIVNDSLLLAHERVELWARISVAEVLFRSAAWALLASLGFGVTACFVVFFIGRCGAALSYRVFAADAPLLTPASVDRREVRRFAGLVPDFAGILVATTLMQRLDFLMLSRLATMQAVATYSAPYRVFEAVQMLPTILTTALFPSLARAAAEADDHAALRRIVTRCTWVIWLVGVPGGLLLWHLSGPLISLLFGDRFPGAAVVLAWLAAVPLVFAFDMIVSAMLQSVQQQRRDVRVWSLGVLTYMVLLLLLIPRLGVRGAAMATLFSVVVQLVARLVVARHLLPVREALASVPRVLVAGVAMGAVLWTMRGAPVLVTALGATAVYVVTVAAVGAVRSTDLTELRSALARREAAA